MVAFSERSSATTTITMVGYMPWWTVMLSVPVARHMLTKSTNRNLDADGGVDVPKGVAPRHSNEGCEQDGGLR